MSKRARDEDSTGRVQRALDRRGFLKSLIGLGVLDKTRSSAVAAGTTRIFWTDLRSGQIGFPTGTTVPCGKPGSVFKLVTAAALIEQRLVQPDETVECTGSAVVDSRTYSCLEAHGKASLIQAIGSSCNVYFALLAARLPAELLLLYGERLGLSSPAAGRPSGAYPDEPQYPVDVYALGLADDLKPSALQILQLAALVAGSGKAPAFRSAEEPDRFFKPFRAELKDSTWSLLQQGMRYAARQGTGSKIDPDDVLKLAVKTGTAPHGKTFQSWVTGYFPDKERSYAFCVRAEIGTSLDAAVPAARKFLFSTNWALTQ